MTPAAPAFPAPLFGQLPAAATSLARGHPAPLAPDLADNQHGDTRFRARFSRLPSGGELRTVHIHGPRIEIINLFHFPAPDRALPVYALELVVFGRRPVVCVIDAKPLAPHPHAAALCRDTLGSAHARFPDLLNAADAPAWYEECRSGLDFFVRPSTPEDLAPLLACHHHVWSRLAAAAQDLAPRLDAAATAAHSAALADYKHHHHLNFPGLPFLHRTFGPDWTDRFLRSAFFA